MKNALSCNTDEDRIQRAIGPFDRGRASEAKFIASAGSLSVKLRAFLFFTVAAG